MKSMHSLHNHARFLVLLASIALPVVAAQARPVTAERIIAADEEPQNWLAHGRTYGEQRYSPLKQVNDGNVGTAACTRPASGASCTRSTRRPARNCGPTIRRCRANGAAMRAATRSIGA
jgi:hypothetical protein